MGGLINTFKTAHTLESVLNKKLALDNNGAPMSEQAILHMEQKEFRSINEHPCDFKSQFRVAICLKY